MKHNLKKQLLSEFIFSGIQKEKKKVKMKLEFAKRSLHYRCVVWDAELQKLIQTGVKLNSLKN